MKTGTKLIMTMTQEDEFHHKLDFRVDPPDEEPTAAECIGICLIGLAGYVSEIMHKPVFEGLRYLTDILQRMYKLESERAQENIQENIHFLKKGELKNAKE